LASTLAVRRSNEAWAAPGASTLSTREEHSRDINDAATARRWTNSTSPRRRAKFERALLAGLAGVFLVNALVAVLQPTDFTGLVDRSLPGRWFPAVTGPWIAWAIGVNDLVLGLCLVTAIWSRRIRPLVLVWAAAWLLAVTVVKVTSLRAFGG
jgi:hypothetical protein